MSQSLIYIAVLGIAGVLARYFVGVAADQFINGAFPITTLCINVVGSFAIGVAYALGVERSIVGPELRLGIMVGFLGGFTTFSTYSLDLVRLLERSEYGYAGLYFVVSSGAGVLATALGLWLTRQLG